MRRQAAAPSRSVAWAILVGLVGLVLGTAAGRLVHSSLPVLARPIGFGPTALNLYALWVTVGVRTNLLGLVGAALGVIASGRR